MVASGGSGRPTGRTSSERRSDVLSMLIEAYEEVLDRVEAQVPPELLALMDNVVVLVEDRNEDEPDLLGLYEGYALTERGRELDAEPLNDQLERLHLVARLDDLLTRRELDVLRAFQWI